MNINKIILLGVFLFQMYILKIWLTCIRLADFFQFSALDAHLKTDNAIMNDVGYGTILVRVFHNKFWVYSIEIFNRYFHFWNTNFEALFISIVGIFGIFYGVYYHIIHSRNSAKHWIGICLITLLPFLFVFSNPIPFGLKIVLFSISLYLLSAFGIYQYLRAHPRRGKWIVLALLLISIWYFAVFQKDIFMQFCYNK